MKRIVLILVVITSTFPGWLSAQDTTEAQDTSIAKEAEAATRLPYQVIVTPTISRTGLRELVADVEEDFYEQFNELNIEDNYDIVCYKHTPTMSHI
jgi:hypothetical protein